tara:strand:- start:348 stop:593 length:246 start_codon:yes stop_codon:yes gene_type:complete
MAFEVNKMHKLADQIEQLAYDWVHTDMCEYFGVEEAGQLTKEQATEMYDYSESDDCYEGYVGTVLRTMYEQWAEENDENDY